MKRIALALLALSCLPTPAVASDVAIRLLQMENRFPDRPGGPTAIQWVRVTNIGATRIRTVLVDCRFFAAGKPIALGTAMNLGILAIGESETINVPGSPAGRADTAECDARSDTSER